MAGPISSATSQPITYGNATADFDNGLLKISMKTASGVKTKLYKVTIDTKDISQRSGIPADMQKLFEEGVKAIMADLAQSAPPAKHTYTIIAGKASNSGIVPGTVKRQDEGVATSHLVADLADGIFKTLSSQTTTPTTTPSAATMPQQVAQQQQAATPAATSHVPTTATSSPSANVDQQGYASPVVQKAVVASVPGAGVSPAIATSRPILNQKLVQLDKELESVQDSLIHLESDYAIYMSDRPANTNSLSSEESLEKFQHSRIFLRSIFEYSQKIEQLEQLEKSTAALFSVEPISDEWSAMKKRVEALKEKAGKINPIIPDMISKAKEDAANLVGRFNTFSSPVASAKAEVFPLAGIPNNTGLNCYMVSTLQTLVRLPAFRDFVRQVPTPPPTAEAFVAACLVVPRARNNFHDDAIANYLKYSLNEFFVALDGQAKGTALTAAKIQKLREVFAMAELCHQESLVGDTKHEHDAIQFLDEVFELIQYPQMQVNQRREYQIGTQRVSGEWSDQMSVWRLSLAHGVNKDLASLAKTPVPDIVDKDAMPNSVKKSKAYDQAISSLSGPIPEKVPMTGIERIGYPPPSILPISLKRYDFDRKATKRSDPVTYDDFLELPIAGSPKKAIYKLSSIVVHQGDDPNSGHYWTYSKRDNDGSPESGKWCLFNDQNVEVAERVGVEQAYRRDAEQNGYLFMYELVSEDTTVTAAVENIQYKAKLDAIDADIVRLLSEKPGVEGTTVLFDHAIAQAHELENVQPEGSVRKAYANTLRNMLTETKTAILHFAHLPEHAKENAHKHINYLIAAMQPLARCRDFSEMNLQKLVKMARLRESRFLQRMRENEMAQPAVRAASNKPKKKVHFAEKPTIISIPREEVGKKGRHKG